VNLRSLFWVLVAAFALWAFVYGAMHPPKPPPIPQPTPLPRLAPSGPARRDLFSNDPVIAGRTPRGGFIPGPARLVAMVGLCGASLANERAMLEAPFPIGVILDPHARDARRVAALAHARGEELFIQSDRAPSASELQTWRREFGSVLGVATRHPDRTIATLAGSTLVVFDERGASNPMEFTRSEIRLIRRDVRIDDRDSVPYITYMLEQATALARRRGIVVLLMRPRANDLTAIEGLLQRRHDVQFVQPGTAERV